MGVLAVPTEQERATTRNIARQITDAVVNDEEGPFALPDLRKAKNLDVVADMLGDWYEDWDPKVMRLAQDLGDSSQALDIACALLARFTPSDAKLVERIRQLDIPEQSELDAIVVPAAPAPVTPTLDPRVMELLDRVTAPGAVASALSASEWHELREELETFRYNSVERNPDDESAG